MSGPKATLKFPLELGALTRGPVVRSLEDYCFTRGLDLDVQERRGLLDSSYRITISGDAEQVKAAKLDIDAWGEALAERERGGE